ncbi:hypothetical protein CRP01_37305 [Flavilitoribacter nigricans DSM 23189 = NBRC 102662]|uniref:Outer membrane protein beta-barrel domain-containing protein n=1 Tax=Flavilitoribacter nigricans (strain ATCC 23147 / DSM 23189 / NBRC 102662 / NCIMB 1420 / SS-2) TaxID=1122177 RepID=A0A2D0MZ96_FLAN2|nr:hypothetical protein CRP01_37305 [Flavilitoribacter nigricans DSM 23189 = NBRC 102662]
MLFLFSQALEAQESENKFYPYMYLGGHLQAGIPVQLFKDKAQSGSYGGGGLFLVQLGPRPIFAGLEVNVHRFDSERITFEEVINGFVEQFEQTTKNNALLAHVVVRAQPWDNSLFRPYLDGLFGVKDLYTRTTVENVETEDTESNTDLQDWSLSYGFAVGVQLGVFRNEAVTIDLRCSYLTGNNATFYTRRPDAVGPFFIPLDAFETQNAPPSMLIPQIGVTVDLSTVDYY